VNLWWGLIMIAFGGALLIWRRVSPAAPLLHNRVDQ
jgi:hypothetical protein